MACLFWSLEEMRERGRKITETDCRGSRLCVRTGDQWRVEAVAREKTQHKGVESSNLSKGGHIPWAS